MKRWGFAWLELYYFAGALFMVIKGSKYFNLNENMKWEHQGMSERTIRVLMLIRIGF